MCVCLSIYIIVYIHVDFELVARFHRNHLALNFSYFHSAVL